MLERADGITGRRRRELELMATFSLGGNQVKRGLYDFANSVGERNNYTLGRLPPTAVATTRLKATDVAEYYVGCFISPCFRGRLWSAVAAFESTLPAIAPSLQTLPSRPTSASRKISGFICFCFPFNKQTHTKTSKVTSYLSCRWR